MTIYVINYSKIHETWWKQEAQKNNTMQFLIQYESKEILNNIN